MGDELLTDYINEQALRKCKLADDLDDEKPTYDLKQTRRKQDGLSGCKGFLKKLVSGAKGIEG